jgi:cytochrome P450
MGVTCVTHVSCVTHVKFRFLLHLFQLTEKQTILDASYGECWKSLRKNMSPTFTSGKLKGMLKPILGTVDNFLEHVEKIAGKEEDVDPGKIFRL